MNNIKQTCQKQKLERRVVGGVNQNKFSSMLQNVGLITLVPAKMHDLKLFQTALT